MSASPEHTGQLSAVKGWPYPDPDPAPTAPAPMAQKSALAAALAKSQGEFGPIHRDKTVKVRMKSGGEYEFSYAPLESILKSVIPALSANNLALSQSVGVLDGKEVVRTELMHADGESITNHVRVMVKDEGPQGYGSALTYARRYGVTLLLCICADEDDDGNAAEGNQAETLKSRAMDRPSVRAAEGRDAFREALIGESDEAIFSVHDNLQKEGDSVYREAWSLLKSEERTEIKRAINRRKAAA